MGSVGQLAVATDAQWLRPAALPAAHLPVRQGLSGLIGDRPLLHYCIARDAAAIVASGLWPGSWCTVTAVSGHVADVWLGTRRKDYVLIIDPRAVINFCGPGLAPGDPADPLRKGGAIEIFLPGGVPPTAILAHGPLEQP